MPNACGSGAAFCDEDGQAEVSIASFERCSCKVVRVCVFFIPFATKLGTKKPVFPIRHLESVIILVKLIVCVRPAHSLFDNHTAKGHSLNTGALFANRVDESSNRKSKLKIHRSIKSDL